MNNKINWTPNPNYIPWYKENNWLIYKYEQPQPKGRWFPSSMIIYLQFHQQTYPIFYK